MIQDINKQNKIIKYLFLIINFLFKFTQFFNIDFFNFFNKITLNINKLKEKKQQTQN